MVAPSSTALAAAPAPPAPVPPAASIDRAVVSTVAYGDVFDYPLDAFEVHRYLHGVRATAEATAGALARSVAEGVVAFHDGYYTLPGRERLVETRRGRAARAATYWPAAIRYGQIIAGMPFVRMVAVTGSLAWDNVPPSADIDYVVVAEPDHLWKCRWLLAVLRRVARLEGVNLCPNCMVTKRALTVWDHDLYVAYELAGMRPIAGLGMYRRLRRANPWTASFLPNAQAELRLPDVDVPREPTVSHRFLSKVSSLGEEMLRSRFGGKLEALEMQYRIRKIMRFRSRMMLQQGIELGEASYGADRCMGFGGGHRRRALSAFAARLDAVGATP